MLSGVHRGELLRVRSNFGDNDRSSLFINARYGREHVDGFLPISNSTADFLFHIYEGSLDVMCSQE